MMVRTMNDNQPLQIPKSKEFKGITVYCGKCKTNINEICKESGKPIKQCLNGNRHFYKLYLHVPGTENTRKTKNLGRDIDEAIKIAIEFEKELKGNNYRVSENKVTKEVKNVNKIEEIKPENIVNAMARYVGFLHNDPEIVPEFRVKERSKKHLQDIERNFKYFIICLKQNGYNPNEISVNDINEQMIGKFHEYLLKELELSNSSYNRAMTEFTCLYNHLIDKGYNIRNPFKSIPRRQANAQIETITADELHNLLEIVQKPELGISVLSTGRNKNMYKPWMKDAIELGLYTGRRNEEIVQMQWNKVFEDEKGNPLYIQVIDYKVSRQKGQEKDNPKYIYVPVTNELKDLLVRIGYENYKGSAKYILAPEETMKRETMNGLISHSFPHYYKQLGTGKDLSFKSLRKTYISKLSGFMGVDNARIITKHSGTEVMEKHYIDKKVIALTAKEFRMFDETENRQNEIQKVRSTNKKHNLER